MCVTNVINEMLKQF